MLGRKSYDADQVAACRAAMATYLGHVRSLPSAAAEEMVGALVIVLDGQFLHRLRGQEGKDAASPLKQARTLAEAVVAGEPVGLDLPAFEALADAFYSEIETRFPPD